MNQLAVAKSESLPPVRRLVLGAMTLATASCARVVDSAPTPVGVGLDGVFLTEAVITLGEDPQDSIATVGIWAERATGGFVVGDGQLPRVRSYHEDGQLEAAFGRFGEGPFEFRRISGLAETSSGRVAVLGSHGGRLTYLTGALAPDTMVRVPGVARGVAPLGDDLLLFMPWDHVQEGVQRFFQRPLMLTRWTASGRAWSAYTLPYVPIERPYWNSISRLPFAVAGDSIYVGFSLRYPVAILNAAGDSIGEIGVPPATFAPVPVFEPGAFSPGAYATQVADLLGGRSTIARIAVVGPHLIIVHGRFGAGMGMTAHHASLDVYDRHTGHKLYEDTPLPEHSRVLGGGRHLYVLQDTRFPPWRVAKLSLR